MGEAGWGYALRGGRGGARWGEVGRGEAGRRGARRGEVGEAGEVRRGEAR